MKLKRLWNVWKDYIILVIYQLKKQLKEAKTAFEEIRRHIDVLKEVVGK